jgi:hypothetical protein
MRMQPKRSAPHSLIEAATLAGMTPPHEPPQSCARSSAVTFASLRWRWTARTVSDAVKPVPACHRSSTKIRRPVGRNSATHSDRRLDVGHGPQDVSSDDHVEGSVFDAGSGRIGDTKRASTPAAAAWMRAASIIRGAISTPRTAWPAVPRAQTARISDGAGWWVRLGHSTLRHSAVRSSIGVTSASQRRAIAAMSSVNSLIIALVKVGRVSATAAR